MPAPAKVPALSFELAPLLKLIPALHWCNDSKWIYFPIMSTTTSTFLRGRIWFIQIFRRFFSPLAHYLCLHFLDKAFIGYKHTQFTVVPASLLVPEPTLMPAPAEPAQMFQCRHQHCPKFTGPLPCLNLRTAWMLHL